jgi:hypothetical protein
VKKISDAEGGSKKRLESVKAIKQGEDVKGSKDGEGAKDKVCNIRRPIENDTDHS